MGTKARTTTFGLIGIAVLMVSGCSGGQRPFRIVQVCLRDPAGVAAFRSSMQSLAASIAMQFIDRSASTHEELLVIDPKNTAPRGEPLINMGIEGPAGMGVSAGNIGLPGYQIALGFSEGSDPGKARRFADSVVREIGGKWHVVEVAEPSQTGAFPLPDCGARS